MVSDGIFVCLPRGLSVYFFSQPVPSILRLHMPHTEQGREGTVSLIIHRPDRTRYGLNLYYLSVPWELPDPLSPIREDKNCLPLYCGLQWAKTVEWPIITIEYLSEKKNRTNVYSFHFCTRSMRILKCTVVSSQLTLFFSPVTFLTVSISRLKYLFFNVNKHIHKNTVSRN